MSTEAQLARITGVALARETTAWNQPARPPWYPAPGSPPTPPPIYATVVDDLGFDPRDITPAPSADELIAESYMAYDRRHARHRRRDEHGRFLPAPGEHDLEQLEDDAEPATSPAP